ncbi:CTP synthase [Clostridiales bacterium]|nr:CTP synthase [Clostridiales bacterium]
MEFLQTLLAIGGGIVLIGNVGSVFYKAFHPAAQVKRDVEELKDHDRKDFEAIQHLNKMNKAQCSLLLSMINHMIDGNGIEKMKETRDDIQKMLSE